MKTNASMPAKPWWLLYFHNGCYGLMGILLFIHPARASPLYAGLLGGLLLLAGLSTGLLSFRLRQPNQVNTSWFVLSSIRNSLFGGALLVGMGAPLPTMVTILGLWGIMYAFIQAVEAMFYFLGTREDEDKDYWIEIIHVVCVLIGGGFSFVLIMEPSPLFGAAGLFLLALALVQHLLTQRLRAFTP